MSTRTLGEGVDPSRAAGAARGRVAVVVAGCATVVVTGGATVVAGFDVCVERVWPQPASASTAETTSTGRARIPVV